MTTAVHPNIAKCCLICGGRLSTLAEHLHAASSRADALYPFTLFECSLCGHVQKDVGPEYQAHLDQVYRVAYTLPRWRPEKQHFQWQGCQPGKDAGEDACKPAGHKTRGRSGCGDGDGLPARRACRGAAAI